MIWFVIFTIVITMSAVFGLWDILRPFGTKKLKPEDYEWGQGKDLSALSIYHKLPLPDSPFNELEQWWRDNESKDARIKNLEAAIATKNSVISKLEDEKYIRRGHDGYTRVPPRTVFSTPADYAKVMVLPAGVSYLPNQPTKVALSIEGFMAKRIMEPDITTKLTIKNGRVIDWDQSYPEDKQ